MTTLGEWLGSILSRNDLARPDGRPLYAYRVDDDELERLRELLAPLRWNAAGVPPREDWAAGFTIFAAERFARHATRGAWRWETVTAALDGDGPDHALIRGLVTRGLGWWGRRVRSNAEGHRDFLFSTVLEGGFPLGRLDREGGAVRQWLIGVLSDVERFGNECDDLIDLVAGRTGLPEFLRRREFHALSVELCSAVGSLRRKFGTAPAGSDPLEWTFSQDPAWHRDLSLRLEDEAARSLLRALIAAGPIERLAGGVPCRRVLCRSADGRWIEGLRIPSGALRRDQLPDDARDMLEGALRARLSGPSGEVAVLERDGDGWTIRPRRDGALDLPFDRALDVSLRVGERSSAPFMLPGSAPIDTDVASLVERDGELVLLAAGSASVTDETIWVLLGGDADARWAGDARVEPHGEIAGRTLWSVQGTAELRTPDGLLVRVASNAGERTNAVVLVPRAPRFAVRPEPASLGWPKLIAEAGLNVSHERTCWRPVGRGEPWRAVDEAARGGGALGPIEIAVLDKDGALSDRVRVVVLPRDLRVDARGLDDHATLDLSGLDGVRVIADGLTEDEAGCATVRVKVIDGAPPPTELDVELAFPTGTRCTLRLPAPLSRARFVDPEGGLLPQRADLGFTELYGVRLRGRGGGMSVHGELSGQREHGLAHTMADGASLSDLLPELRALLARSNEIDAHVRIEADGTQLRVRRFAHELEPHGNGCRIPDALGTHDDVPVRAVTFDLHDPRLGRTVLREGAATELAGATLEHPDPDRSLMLWIELADRALTRPALLRGTHAPDCGFGRAASHGQQGDRIEAMRAHLRARRDEPRHEDWERLHAALGHLADRVPLVCYDWFSALALEPLALVTFLANAGSPEAVARVLDMDAELDIAWELATLQQWRCAFKALRQSLRDALGQDDLADLVLSDRPGGIVRERPALTGAMMMLAGALSWGNPAPDWRLKDTEELVQQALRRHGERQWPSLDVLFAYARDRGLHQRCLDAKRAVLAAPDAAARHVLGHHVLDANGVRDVRRAMAFAPDYFAAALPTLTVRHALAEGSKP